MTTLAHSGNLVSQDPREVGRWDVLSYKSQVESIHMALLHTGKVLYYSGFRYAEAVKTETRLWYPKTGEIKAPSTPGDIFCAGHSFLPDGRLLSTGGTLEYRNPPPLPPWLVRLLRPLSPTIVHNFERFVKNKPTFTGTTFLYLFDPEAEQWEFASDMVEGRWYPTNTTLPDGRIMILSGSNQGGGFGSGGGIKTNMRLEVYHAEEGIKQVATIPEMNAQDGDTANPSRFPSLYPRMHVLPLSEKEKDKYPAGKVFYSGYGPETKMLDLHTWEWTDVSRLKFGLRHDGCAVLLPLRPPDYRARVLTFGGSQQPGMETRATETAEMIDFGQTSPSWEWVDSMQEKRAHACSVLLPDGKVLAVGGVGTALFDDPVTDVEVFDPDEQKWRLVAPITVPRGYHAVAILLPDGRVVSSGTTPFGKYELRMEVYSPYYLFKGPRPQIREAPPSLAYGQSFEVAYEHAGRVNSVVLIRPGAMTHAFDMNQRYVELEAHEQGPTRLAVRAPRDAHVAPPGYYMLFLLSEDGVPSEAEFVHLPIPSLI
jgi:hypothetical protein